MLIFLGGVCITSSRFSLSPCPATNSCLGPVGVQCAWLSWGRRTRGRSGGGWPAASPLHPVSRRSPGSQPSWGGDCLIRRARVVAAVPRGWSGLSGWEGVSAGPVGLAGLEGCTGGAGRLVKSRCRGVRGDAQTAGLALGGRDKGPPLGSCVSVVVRATPLRGWCWWASRGGQLRSRSFGSGEGEWEAKERQNRGFLPPLLHLFISKNFKLRGRFR